MFQVSQGFPDQKDTIFVYGVSPQSYFGQAGNYAIGIDSAHAYATGQGVKVGVIDNGLDYSHPLIEEANILPGYDFIENDTLPAEETGQMQSHGTFVTSLILLTAPNCSIVPLRTFDADGAGTQYDIAAAIYWAIDHDVDVLNFSFGCDVAAPVLTTAIQAATNAGIVMVAAAGNQGEDIQLYPARVDEVIAVAAIDTTEMRADFSNYGNHIALCAPGVSLHGAFFDPQYNWGIWSGTSFSAPIVTGTCALVKQLQSGYNSSQVEALLETSARTDLAWGSITAPDSEYGFGLLNALSAVISASGN
jgi:subtilisin family serine protease